MHDDERARALQRRDPSYVVEVRVSEEHLLNCRVLLLRPQKDILCAVAGIDDESPLSVVDELGVGLKLGGVGCDYLHIAKTTLYLAVLMI